ncbi:uncharacterized metal-binding protein YceD (DUF177 family) [Roseovarius sp. MBR-154]|jgi:uncharacterized metal-binding protein YceD (DUF177 family)
MHSADTIRLSQLRGKDQIAFEVAPDGEARKRIAEDLGLLDLRKLRLRGHLAAEGRTDWRLSAELGATVVQPCVVTLDAVTTRIDEPVTRLFSPDATLDDVTPGEEMEMPEDDTLEPLGQEIDLRRVLVEALSLALPPWPRRDDAELGQVTAAAEGAEPLTDEDTKPFADLKALRDQLKRDE